MSDDVREAAARALYEGEPLPGIPTWNMAVGESDEWPLSLARVTVTRLRNLADAALAAIADHDGLVEVLRGHEWDGGVTLNLGYYRTQATCICGATYWGGRHDEDPSLEDAFAAHLADVVRAWLRGE